MFARLGHHCPRTYNPADYFIETLAITAQDYEQSKARVTRVCNAFADGDGMTQVLIDVDDSLKDPPKFHHPLNPVGLCVVYPTQTCVD
jgi:hypothetical protein